MGLIGFSNEKEETLGMVSLYVTWVGAETFTKLVNYIIIDNLNPNNVIFWRPLNSFRAIIWT